MTRKGWDSGKNWGCLQSLASPGCLCPAHLMPQNSHLPILTPTFPPCLQSSAPLVTTTTPASIAVSAVPWVPISLTSVKTSAPAVQETQALTLMAPPAWPSARVCSRPGGGKRGREAWEQWPWEEAGGRISKPTGSKAREWWAGKSHPPSLPTHSIPRPVAGPVAPSRWTQVMGSQRGEVR